MLRLRLVPVCRSQTERRHDIKDARRIGTGGGWNVDDDRLTGAGEVPRWPWGVAGIERRREVMAETERCNRAVSHTVMLGVVEMMPRRRVLIDGQAVECRAENIALTHEADQVVGGVIEANRAISILARPDHQIAVVEIRQRNFVGVSLLMKSARRVRAVVNRIFPLGDEVD